MKLSDFPYELLLNIFLFLQFSDILKINITCSHIYLTSQLPIFYKLLFFRDHISHFLSLNKHDKYKQVYIEYIKQKRIFYKKIFEYIERKRNQIEDVTIFSIDFVPFIEKLYEIIQKGFIHHVHEKYKHICILKCRNDDDIEGKNVKVPDEVNLGEMKKKGKMLIFYLIDEYSKYIDFFIKCGVDGNMKNEKGETGITYCIKKYEMIRNEKKLRKKILGCCRQILFHCDLNIKNEIEKLKPLELSKELKTVEITRMIISNEYENPELNGYYDERLLLKEKEDEIQEYIKNSCNKIDNEKIILKWNKLLLKYSSNNNNNNKKKMIEKLLDKHGIQNNKLRIKVWNVFLPIEKTKLENKGLYMKLKTMITDDQSSLRCIHLDIPRLMINNVYFDEYSSYTVSLFNVLKASVHYGIHYSSGMGNIVSILLILLSKNEEDTFWCFILLLRSEKYFKDLFDEGFQKLVKACDLLDQVLEKTNPRLYKHFQGEGVDQYMIVTKWVMIFTIGNLGNENISRIFDLIVSKGYSFVLCFIHSMFNHFEKEFLCLDFNELVKKFQYLDDEIKDDKKLIEKLVLTSIKYHYKCLFVI